MDFNLIETFNDNCGISFETGDITTKECKQYSDDSYKTLRNNYLDTILEKFLDSDASNQTCNMNNAAPKFRTNQAIA